MRRGKVFILLISLLVTVLTLSLIACTKPVPSSTPPPPPPKTTTAPPTSPPPKPPTATTPTDKPSPTATSAVSEVPAGAQPIKLRFAGSLPVNHVLSKGANKLKELVEKRSKGVITVDVYPASQLYEDTDFPDVIPAGTVDMAQGSPEKWAGIAPVVQYTNLVANWEDYDHLFRFIDGPGYQVLDREMRKVGATVLGYGFYGGAWGIVSNKPLQKLEDIKNMQIRVTDAVAQAGLIALGAKGIILSSGEAHTALQRGTIDTALSLASSFVERKWYEIAKYTLLFPKPSSWSGTEFPIMMSLKKWNSLPPWAQKILRESAIEADKWTRPEATKSELDDIETLKTNSTTYVMPDTEWARWRAIASKATIDYYVQLGGDAAKAILVAIEATRKTK